MWVQCLWTESGGLLEREVLVAVSALKDENTPRI